jgi:DivIVA domain-containing protein
MREILLLLVVALVAAAIVFGVVLAITGAARGLQPVEPDERARRLPGDRPLAERDLGTVRFDVTVRGYRMAQVDAALRRVSYDLGYKQELIAALEAEVAALRDGRTADADLLRERRLAAAAPARPAARAATDPVPPVDDDAHADAGAADETLAPADAVPAGEPGLADDTEAVEGGSAGAAASAADQDDATRGEADGSAVGEPDTDGGANGRADGAARRIADRPAVS